MIRDLLTKVAEDGPSVHIAPGGLFNIGGFEITNAILFGWICAALLIVLFAYIAKKMTIKPKGGFTQIVEIGTEFVVSMLSGSLGSREKAVKYAPYFATIFFFIAITNILGLFPGVGDALTVDGTPLFRAFTADLNGTLAAAVISMSIVQYLAMRESGFIKHLRHYFAGKLWNPMTYVIGLYEILNEFIRVISLALRLFLNVAIGEIIIAVFSYLGKVAAPITALPFLCLELGVAILQAYIFVMLSVTYLSLAVKHGHDEDDALEATAEGAKA